MRLYLSGFMPWRGTRRICANRRTFGDVCPIGPNPTCGFQWRAYRSAAIMTQVQKTWADQGHGPFMVTRYGACLHTGKNQAEEMALRVMRVAGGLALALATSDAYAQSELPKRSIGDQGYTFAPYAQLHFAWQQVDDGRASTGNIVDITNANSRVGFYIERPDAMGFSFQFESGLGFRPSAKTSQTNTPVFFDWSRRDLRQVQVIHRSQAGTFRLGHGSMPLDGAAESDLGKTVVVAKSTIPEANGSYILRSTTGVLTPLTIGDTFDNYDGTRRLRLRYDTPDFSGFSLAVAYGEEVLRSGDDNTYYDVAIRYEGQVGKLRHHWCIGVRLCR